MVDKSPYDILFEPIKIGPKTAKNRFYQVPHCNGMGHRWPRSMARMREVKAEGGWAVVCTEECEIHPSSDLSGGALMRLWDDSDIPTHARMVEGIQRHGALAGIQLVHNGHATSNRFSRIAPMAPTARAVRYDDPLQARGMDRQDIRNLRQWHARATRRAITAGYDIIYVYAGHNLTLLMHFLSPRYNQRSDEYGGCLENRLRLIREILEETKEIAGDRAAVAFRFAVDELIGPDGIRCDGEGREVVELLADLPDLWDVNISDWSNDSITSRFGDEGHQEPYIDFVKKVTNKPVVGVGRFTSPDAMVSQIRRGVLDMIGAARPSIADPFLPNKIRQGRMDEIRECIGCNICTSGDMLSVPIRCSQNPTMGEEWRKGWHPENIEPKGSDDSVLIVGSGPAGLEAALALSNRGYEVVVAEKDNKTGGRLNRECLLPGFAAWRRVIDYRSYMLSQKDNVNIYLNSELGTSEILDFGFGHVVIATGSAWRIDGVGRGNDFPIPVGGVEIFSPEQIIDGTVPSGRLVIFDDDHYYMASALAEWLHELGVEVIFVTPSSRVASWTENTLEQQKIQAGLIRRGIPIICNRIVTGATEGEFTLKCTYTGTEEVIRATGFLPVTSRLPNDILYHQLMTEKDRFGECGIKSITRIGDCHNPSTIAAAVYHGHLHARGLDSPKDHWPKDQWPKDQWTDFRRENIQI
ncbi:Histamine dehydrogenase [hydrothermal vent metagenome]|uniref:Histamine dehydrogenase n=1 Tax=hydrothermal vent metagenome TaxID=652676 RepID=A0A3B0SAK3_9ZZZZ